MTTDKREFQGKEFDKLSNEISKLLEEIHSRERYSLTIIAAVAVWIFDASTECPKPDGFILRAASLVPLATTILYGLSTWFLYKNINKMGIYLKKIEASFYNSKPDFEFGWEKFFEKELPSSLKVRSKYKSKIVRLTTIVWGLQLIFCLGLMVYTFRYLTI